MNIKEFIRSKEWAYRQRLGVDDEAVKIILADLRMFCNGTKTTFSNDPLEMARLTGRKEVFERIMTFLNYDYSKIYDLEEDVVE